MLQRAHLVRRIQAAFAASLVALVLPVLALAITIGGDNPPPPQPLIGIRGKFGSLLRGITQSIGGTGGLGISCDAIPPGVTLPAPVVTQVCVRDTNSLLSWDTSRGATRQALRNIERLRSEVARTWPGSAGSGPFVVTGTLCLRCPASPQQAVTLSGTFPPEGRVWKVENRDLVLRNVTFQGRGTIMVVNGNLVVEGSNSYLAPDSNHSVGFIVVGGNTTFKPGGATLQRVAGAYLTTGTARLNDPAACSTVPFDLNGSLVANRFDFSGRRTTC